jgi:hypothetical protein
MAEKANPRSRTKEQCSGANSQALRAWLGEDEGYPSSLPSEPFILRFPSVKTR